MVRRGAWTAVWMLAVSIPVPATLVAQSTAATSWLDRPLINWNTPGARLKPVRAPARVDPKCPVVRPSTAGERAVEAAGLIPFLNFDQPLVRGDVEIVGGMSGADEMCAPVGYNLYVFISGRFVGTLSPDPMVSRTDASSGAVRILAADTISAEFARYTSKDATCCASARMTVRYRIDRAGPQPLLVPVDVRITRAF